eukprot:1048491-Prymnesium_polylepis.1
MCHAGLQLLQPRADVLAIELERTLHDQRHLDVEGRGACRTVMHDERRQYCGPKLEVAVVYLDCTACNRCEPLTQAGTRASGGWRVARGSLLWYVETFWPGTIVEYAPSCRESRVHIAATRTVSWRHCGSSARSCVCAVREFHPAKESLCRGIAAHPKTGAPSRAPTRDPASARRPRPPPSPRPAPPTTRGVVERRLDALVHDQLVFRL